MKKLIKQLIHKNQLYKTRKRWLEEENKFFSQKKFPPLESKEIKEINKVWKGLSFSNKHIKSHRIYKSLHGFNAKYLSMPIYDPIIVRALNPFQDACVFVNKGLFDNLFSGLPQPYYFVKRIDNHYFSSGSKLITKNEAIDILSNQNKFIIKPSINSHGGANIKLICDYLSKKEINDLLKEYKSDFITQEIIEQHEDTAKFNPQSLNTIRLMSLFINDHVSVLKSALRCGQNGSEIDNASAGGLMIKINKDGSLEDFGIDHRLDKIYQTSNGIIIKNQKITHYSKLEKIVIENHPKLYPTLHLIAWDFAIDKNGNPIFIEGNTKVPGIFWIQLCAGPIFGERTKEVIDYVISKKKIKR